MIKGQIKNKRVFTGFLKRLEKFGTSTYVKRDVSVRCARRYRVALKKYIRGDNFPPRKLPKLKGTHAQRRAQRAFYAARNASVGLVRTGKYVNSIHLERAGLNSVVVTDVEYGPYLEFGTRNMEARPHWMPTLDKCVSDGDFDKIIEQYVSSFLQGKL